MKRITIAIDGHSSCGKSTFAKAIASRMGYIFIDTGAMYRAVTLFAIESGYFSGDNLDKEALVASLERIKIAFKRDQSGKCEVTLGGESVEQKIRRMDVSSHVSQVSAIKEVRQMLVAQQQGMGTDGGVVMDGRDIGTVVFPSAELKIFMTASPQVRARRRYDELKAKGESYSLEEIVENVISRDHADQTREESPLVKASDAILLDNSQMTPTQQMEWFEQILSEIAK